MTDVITKLQAKLGDRVRVDEPSRAAHRRDTWVLSQLEDMDGPPAPLPQAVVMAESTEDVVCTLRICRELRVPVVPFGGGSGVCGAVVAPAGSIVLSTAAMTGAIRIDEIDQTATFRAGTNGMDAERCLQERGLTAGHWPQSIELSTVGGWVATRASGQFSTAYGNIEDILLDLEAVLPDGSVVRTRRTPRASAGPDLRQWFLGSEGTLGVITEVTLSLRTLPEASRGQAYHFASLSEGLGSIRELMRAGWRPPVVRLYDARESERHFPETCPGGRAMLILLHEGPSGLVQAQTEGVAEICRRGGGVATDSAAVDHWLGKRNDVPGFESFLQKGIILDTIEVAATWSRAAELYERAMASLAEVPSLLLASAHSSHSYRSGTNLYITFVARPESREQMADVYRECWKRTLDASLAVGGGIAHHHGIGRVRRDRMGDEIGSTGVALLRALKRTLDPEDLCNPGVLLPDVDGR